MELFVTLCGNKSTEKINAPIDNSILIDYISCALMIAGWSSLVARRAHNPKVAGSNPAPATK